jgi:hypothetical protein
MILYDNFIESLQRKFGDLEKLGYAIESQRAEPDGDSARFRVESETYLGEILVWKQTATFQQTVAALEDSNFVYEVDGCPIPTVSASEAIPNFFRYFE